MKDIMDQRLAAFGALMLKWWHNDGEMGDLNALDIEDAAVFFGLAERVPVPDQPCCEECNCHLLNAIPGEDTCTRIRAEVAERMRWLVNSTAPPAPATSATLMGG
ncbi:MAG: hypothetical protein QJR02_07355 [Sinobacteraceae bacterium]|nr:hypothetical protein [Nevskiaceae bacterium]